LERQSFAELLGRLAARSANRLIRIVIDLAALDDGDALVE
jgi:hypothetical protein